MSSHVGLGEAAQHVSPGDVGGAAQHVGGAAQHVGGAAQHVGSAGGGSRSMTSSNTGSSEESSGKAIKTGSLYSTISVMSLKQDQVPGV